MDTRGLSKKLCETFCSNVSVHPVPAGYAIKSVFEDRSGDPISFYLIEDIEGLHLMDDGEYLSRLVASGIPIDQGGRLNLLNSILEESNSYWDQDTFEIRSPPITADNIAPAVIAFMSSLIRVRDLELVTRDVVRSTFKDDVMNAMKIEWLDEIVVEENTSVDRHFSEFPADILLRPQSNLTNKTGAVYLATSNDKLNEALLLQMEAEREHRRDIAVFALIEDSDMRHISKARFQRAQNRGLAMPIFRGDEDGALKRIKRDMFPSIFL